MKKSNLSCHNPLVLCTVSLDILSNRFVFVRESLKRSSTSIRKMVVCFVNTHFWAHIVQLG